MAHNLARRIAVAAIAIPATIVIVYAGGWALVALLGAVGAVGTAEFYRLAVRRGVRAFVVVGCAGAAAIAPVAWLVLSPAYHLAPRWLAFVLAFWLMGVMGVATATRPPDQRPLADVGVTVAGALYAGGLPVFLLLLRYPDPQVARWSGTGLALLPLAVTWICDTCAMGVGALIGGARLAPILSPGKTWAGAVGGGVGALVGALLYGDWVLAPLGVRVAAPGLLLCGLAVATLGQVGDVAESLFKREAGVKDSGSFFPGHGGMLDRLDSLYWSVPAVALVLTVGGVL